MSKVRETILLCGCHCVSQRDSEEMSEYLTALKFEVCGPCCAPLAPRKIVTLRSKSIPQNTE